MAAAKPENNLPPVTGDSKSARKKKAKAGLTDPASTSNTLPIVPNGAAANEDSSVDGASKADADVAHEHPYIRELTKQIRNINKKLLGMQKTDSILAENPGVSLDDLVAAKKINADQKASVLKKPHLKEQLDMVEAQMQHYRQFENELQARFVKQREDLLAQNQLALAQAKAEAKQEALTTSTGELRRKLLVFSQFLRCAAHKRTVEDDLETDENRAFEGALLLVYGGDDKAVETAINIIDGSSTQVPSIEGVPLPIQYSQVKQASIDHAPYQLQEAWVDQVAEATANAQTTTLEPSGSDPTITHAGLTELAPQENGVAPAEACGAVEHVTDAFGASGNTAGERWDTTAAGAAETSGLEDSFEMVPRPQDEVDVHTSEIPSAAQQGAVGKTSWADEPPAYELSGATGNQAGERWDLKPAGDVQTDNAWPSDAPTQAIPSTAAVETVTTDGDGFQSVAGRQRGGRGGRGHGGEFRGRGGRGGRGGGGGGFRGDGEFRGRGRGGGFRGGRGGDGEDRDRGRGRGGPRGGAALSAATAATDGQPPR